VPSRQLSPIDRVASLVPLSAGDDCVRVGIDGVDGAGKTTFADDLAAAVRRQGRPVVRVSVDDFHHPRAIRYARGRHSPEGFWQDSFDYARLTSDVLVPLGPGGTREFRRAAHALETDTVLDLPAQRAAPGSVVVLDGLFLHRDELVQYWDFSVLLDVPLSVSLARMAARDGSNPDPSHPSVQRYVRAQQIYLQACRPRDRASVVVDNS
jgi:uridine kinase